VTPSREFPSVRTRFMSNFPMKQKVFMHPRSQHEMGQYRILKIGIHRGIVELFALAKYFGLEDLNFPGQVDFRANRLLLGP